MSKPVKWWVGTAGVAMVLGTAAGCGTHPAAKPASPTLAVINGQPLTKKEWKVAVNAIGMLQQQTISTSKSAEKQWVKQLAIDASVEQYVLKHHWITTAKAQTEAKQIVNQNLVGNYGSLSATKTALKQAHLSMASMTTFLSQQMELEAAFSHEAKLVKAPTQAQLLAYYSVNKSQFTTPIKDEMRMILVKTDSLAKSLMTQLQQGGSWKTLAQKYSLDTSSKGKGGEYGWVDTGSQSGFVTPFYTEMDKLKPGQYGIAHTQYGYHVIEVQATKPATVQSFGSVKKEISATLLQQAQDTAFQTFSNKIAKKSHITYKI